MFQPKKLLFLSFFLTNFFSFNSFASENFNDKTYSILSVKYVVNEEVANRIDSRFKCKLSFRDDYKEKVEVIEDDESNYITLISNPGKIYLEYVNCNSHNIPLIFGKSRKKYIEDWGFVAHHDFLNYAGEITINFDASSFQILDFINLSNFLEDSGKIRFDVVDNTTQILNFINYKYTEFSKHRLIKSLFTENRKLQPNDFNNNDIIQNSTQYFHQKNPNENNYSNKIENNNVKISQKDLNPKPDNPIKNAVKKPIHPYLAPIYSDYYNPIFNPYNTVNLAPNPYLSPSSEIQDPAIDRYYFDDEIKNLDLK
ncbi:MAG: hypothetical protein ACO201_04340 [Rickettsiales bacterium]